MSTERQPGGTASSSHEPPPDMQKRILIVDDEEGLRSLCATFLQRRGYDVVTCPDGAAAWAQLNSTQGSFDLLITDNEMPLLGGAQLIDRVRAGRHPIRILSISGSQAAAKDPFPAAKVDAILPKPFTIQELGSAVKALLPNS